MKSDADWEQIDCGIFCLQLFSVDPLFNVFFRIYIPTAGEIEGEGMMFYAHGDQYLGMLLLSGAVEY